MKKEAVSKEVSPFKQALAAVLAGALILICACSTGKMPKSQSTTLTPAEQEEQDPEFWRIWQERRGLGE